MADSADAGAPGWVELALREYDAHRAEILAEGAASQQILALGATAVGLVVAGALNVWDERGLVAIAFIGVVPVLSALVLVQLAGRAAALMRVGVYLEGLETALRASADAPHPVMTWEKLLAARRTTQRLRPKAGWSDMGAAGIFFLLGLGSIVLGASHGWEGREKEVTAASAALTVAFLLVSVAAGWGMKTAREKAREGMAASSGETDTV